MVLWFPSSPRIRRKLYASSRTTCELEPPKPNELTDARRRVFVGHATGSFGIWMVVRANLENADWRTHLDMEELVINARVQILVVGAIWRNYPVFQG